MSNLSGKAYALNVVTPMPRWHWWLKTLIFIIVRAVPSLMDGLRGLSFIHFARWVVLRADRWPDFGQARPHRMSYNYTLFCSNFNGTWDEYIDAFSDGIPVMLDLAWFGDFGYPHSIPLESFRRYIHHNQVATDYYYSATPGASQREVKAALRVWREVRALETVWAKTSPEDFARLYAAALTRVQNDLGAQGPAPVASLDTMAVSAGRLQGFVVDERAKVAFGAISAEHGKLSPEEFAERLKAAEDYALHGASPQALAPGDAAPGVVLTAGQA